MKLYQQALIAMLGVAVFSVSIPIQAFEFPLTDEQIREAYFVGKENPDRMRAFLETYRHTFPAPTTGAQVGLIELETPFVQIVDRVSRTGFTYHAPDAVEDYLGKPEQLRVHIEIYFTPTYPPAGVDPNNPGPFWEDYRIILKQKADVPPTNDVGRPIWNDSGPSGVDLIIGAMIDLDYDLEKIDSYSEATITVDTPDGQHLKTTFDLGHLQ